MTSAIRLHDGATGEVRDLTPALGRILRIGAGDGVRAAVTADLLRRLADRRRWQTSVLGRSSLTDRQLLYLNVHPFHDPGPDPAVELEVRAGDGPAHPDAVRAVVVGAVLDGGVDPMAPPDGIDPLAVRLALLATPYREPVSLDQATVTAAQDRLSRWRELVAGWAETPSAAMPADRIAEVVAHLEEDLDAPGALDALDRLARDEGVTTGARFEAFAHLDRLLGLDLAREVGRSRR